MIVRGIYAFAFIQFVVVLALLFDNMDLLKQLQGGPKPPQTTQATPSKPPPAIPRS